MPNTRITGLSEDTTPADDDLVATVDVSDTTQSAQGSTKKVQAQNLVVKKLRTSTGPAVLTVGAVADGEFLKRSGTSIISAAAGGGGLGDVVGPASATDNALARFDTTTGKLIQNSAITADDDGAVTVPEIAAPSTPATGKVVLYAKSDGLLYSKDDAGTETQLGGGAGAPADATYITQTSNGSLSNEQALGSLSTGVLKNSTTTGVLSIATVDDISAPVFAADSGANDTYTATLSPSPVAYTTGVHYRFKANTANTGACTINFNGLGAKTIKKVAGGITTDLADNDIRAGQWVELVYDGTNMQMVSQLGNGAAGLNPTSGVMPYNNAGTFGDSHLTRTSATVTTIADGTVLRAGTSAYSYGFTGQTSSGMWLEGTDQLHFSINGKHLLNVFYQSSSRQSVLVEQGQGALGFGGTTLQAGFYMPSAGHVAVIADHDVPPTNSGTLYSPRRELETSSNNLVVNLAKGNVRNFTLDNNYNVNAPTNARNGTILVMRIKQSAGGGNTLTWDSAWKFAGGSAPTMTATANKVDIYVFLLDGTNAEELYKSQNIG